MARYDDGSIYCRRWTNAKLMREARKYANLESFSTGLFNGPETTFKPGWASQNGSPDIDQFCRDQTRMYR